MENIVILKNILKIKEIKINTAMERSSDLCLITAILFEVASISRLRVPARHDGC